MSQQEFYETVQRQEEHMKDFLESAKEDLKGVEYCPYCIEPRGDKRSCCGENHFINFEDFDDDTQRDIVQAEYDSSFGK
jgi:hypothetical protein